MAASPTSRTLKHLRDLGFVAQVTEHWNPFAKIRQDLFGFIDIVAMKERCCIGVQATSKSNISARVKKILGITAAKMWLLAGNTILVIGWGKRKGSRSWEPTIREITLDDFRDFLTGLDPAEETQETAGSSDENSNSLADDAAGQDAECVKDVVSCG